MGQCWEYLKDIWKELEDNEEQNEEQYETKTKSLLMTTWNISTVSSLNIYKIMIMKMISNIISNLKFSFNSFNGSQHLCFQHRLVEI